MKKYILLGLCILMGNAVASQEVREKRANKNYDKFAYIKASELYEKLVKKGYESKDLYGKLADTYYFNARYADAVPYYTKMLAYDNVEPVYYYRYAQCLKAEERYEEADRNLQQFYTLIGQPLEDRESLLEQLRDIGNFSGRYTVEDSGINTEKSDFGTAFYGENKVLFASARDTGLFVKRTHKWNQEPFLKLYSAEFDSSGILKNPVKFGGKINSKYHQSTPAVTKDGQTMYFTRNNFLKKYRKSEKGTNHLKIYRAKKIEGKWGEIEDLSINSDEFSTAHPALSADEKQLYFVSDRPGTRGMSDLFVTEIRPDGSLGPVQNLGDGINTEGRESFPFVSGSGKLYFASDGHSGFGGMDVFAVIRDPFDNYRVVNIGEPVNSPADDFAYIVNEGTKQGYFSSNRDETTGFDNIYTFTENRPIAIEVELCGHVQDSLTRAPLGGTEIVVYDENGQKLKTYQADASGDFCIEVTAGQNYNFRFTREEYRSHEEFVARLKAGEKRQLLIELNREDILVTTGDDLTEKLGLKPIYFDFDKDNIRNDAAIELAKVIEVMQQYPGIVIDVRSHTDSRGSDSYNLKLSDRRARSTVKYIIEKGDISPERISGKGYGETQLINECDNSTSCSAEKHQLNRRSEFIIIKM